MKTTSLLLISFVLIFSVAFAQEKEKKKKNKSRPKTAVVELESEIKPIVIPTPVVEKPANGSLFTPNAQNLILLEDFRARRVGDLIFVDVSETSTATVTSGATRERNSGDIGGLGTLVGALPVSGAEVASNVLGALGKREYEGKGSTNRRSNVRARLTARVVEVLPNGDLRIEALKLVRLNKETEQLALSGIVRRSDLAADNSISTFSIGDLRVDLNGKGVASADNAPGWLFRLFDKLSPF
jgi:flagellar L-ring protein precursor FlgH